MTAKQDWKGKVGDVWALEWQRTDRSFAELTDELISRAVELASDFDLHHILDVGCGAGSTSLFLADKISGAEVVGVDVSSALIELANSRALDNSCRFELGDVATWSEPDFAPDLIFSRHGVMFFDHPEAAFAHLTDISSSQCRLIFSCFRSPEENAWAQGLSALLGSSANFDPDGPGPFSLADDEKVRRILSNSGWVDIHAEAVNFRYVAGAGENAIADAIGFFNRIGPLASALREAGEDVKHRILDRLRIFVEENSLSGRVAFPAAAWIFTAARRDGS